jgi:hypothetical protein
VPLALAIAAGVGIAALVEMVFRQKEAPEGGRDESRPYGRPSSGRGAIHRAPSGWWGLATVAVAVLVAATLVLYPAHYDGNFVQDRTPEISAYLRTLPPETIVLAPPVESDSVPAFSGRRVLMNREYALAYHLGYYREVERRVRDGIAMYYAETPRQLVALADAHGVTAVILDPAAFDPATAADAWAGSFAPYTSAVLEQLQPRRRFALLDERRRCGAMSEGELTVVLINCLRGRVQP